MKMTKKELRKIAKQIVDTNMAIWRAIHLAEELTSDERIKNMSDEDAEKIVEIMVSYKNGLEDIATPCEYALYFQYFETIAVQLKKYLDKYLY